MDQEARLDGTILAGPLTPDARRSAFWALSRALALSGGFGLALGARFGLPSMAIHAAGVPVALTLVGVLAVPTFYVGVAHAGVEIEPASLVTALIEGAETTARVLAGLAPAMLLLGVTCENASSVAAYGALGLATAGGFGLRSAFERLRELPSWTSAGARTLRLLFVLFAGLLGARLFGELLPVFGGGS
jgi:hypothetical protein